MIWRKMLFTLLLPLRFSLQGILIRRVPRHLPLLREGHRCRHLSGTDGASSYSQTPHPSLPSKGRQYILAFGKQTKHLRSPTTAGASPRPTEWGASPRHLRNRYRGRGDPSPTPRWMGYNKKHPEGCFLLLNFTLRRGRTFRQRLCRSCSRSRRSIRTPRRRKPYHRRWRC